MYTPPAILGLQILILLDFYSNKSPACPIKELVALTLTFKTFSDTGDRVLKEDYVVSVGISSKPKMENLFLAKSEIDDYFSKNLILGISDVDDLKSCPSMIRELRVKFKKSKFVV